MEVLDSVDTEHDMSAETRARIFEPFYTPKTDPRMLVRHKRNYFQPRPAQSRAPAVRSEHFRQVQLLPSSRIRALRFSRIAKPSMPLRMPHPNLARI
jgi:hypothetical protein